MHGLPSQVKFINLQMGHIGRDRASLHLHSSQLTARTRQTVLHLWDRVQIQKQWSFYASHEILLHWWPNNSKTKKKRILDQSKVWHKTITWGISDNGLLGPMCCKLNKFPDLITPRSKWKWKSYEQHCCLMFFLIFVKIMLNLKNSPLLFLHGSVCVLNSYSQTWTK